MIEEINIIAHDTSKPLIVAECLIYATNTHEDGEKVRFEYKRIAGGSYLTLAAAFYFCRERKLPVIQSLDNYLKANHGYYARNYSIQKYVYDFMSQFKDLEYGKYENCFMQRVKEYTKLYNEYHLTVPF